MTTPTPVTPSKAKAWVGLIGAALTALIPYVLTVSTVLPEPWPAVVGGFIALLTALGVYHAPYVQPGTAVVAVTAPAPPVPPPSGPYRNPWK